MWFENMAVIKIYFTGFMTNYTNYTRVGPSTITGLDWWTDTTKLFIMLFNKTYTRLELCGNPAAFTSHGTNK